MSTRGRGAEDRAAAFLVARGLVVLTRNYRCRYGEIDIVVRDGATVIFVEVRMRASAAFGGAAASITPAKQTKLKRAARHYLATLRALPACRFDALLIEGDAIEWLQNAFEA